jgi:hypothetical protein
MAKKWICRIPILLGLVWFCGAEAGTTWYVDASVSQSGNGQSWQTAFKTVQEGIDAATDSDAVVVAPGTYKENIRFKGKNIVLRSRASHFPSWTILDGRQAGAVVTFSGTEDETCVLAGFTLRNGEATGGDGGGICGGTIEQHTHATIENNVITGNLGIDTWFRGGGLAYCDGIIRNNTISDNTVILPTTPYGPNSEGGGLYQCNGTIRNNVISQNAAEPKGNGGGLCRCSGTIQYNAISANTAGYGGGLFGCNGLIADNTIEGNAAGGDGGGLYSCNGTVQSNLIVGNSAAYGGGLCDCQGAVRNNTIVANAATGPAGVGGGLYVCNGGVYNCIIRGNTASQYGQLFGCSQVRYSCIEGWSGGGEGNIAGDPAFVDTEGPDEDPATYHDNDYRLSLDSPCIDAGDNSVLTPPGFDLDGNLRIAYGRTSLTADMGAYEHNSLPCEVTQPVADGGGVRLAWSSQPNDTYTVWSCVELSSGIWIEETTIPSQGATTSWTDSSPLGRMKSYRVEMK